MQEYVEYRRVTNRLGVEARFRTEWNDNRMTS